MFADEDIELQNVWASSKSQVATTFLITLVGPTNVSIMKLKCTLLNRMWQHDFKMKQIFSIQYFCPKTQANWLSRLATQAMIPDTHGANIWLALRFRVEIHKTF
jgi:hypothetical protein